MVERDDHIRNLGSLGEPHPFDPFGWTVRNKAKTQREADMIAKLKTTSTLNKEMWIQLAQLYKDRGVDEFPRCEVAYVGARLCDVMDRDLMRKWCGVFQVNRPNQFTESQMLEELNIANQALIDVVNGGDARVLREMQHLLFVLDSPELMEQGAQDG